ncbi:ABC transporter permease [Succinispira mobilis]|uniref:ABC transporter permease n=1 Tax=Succinispira mobilis TaxID=78120 RepID=UPI000361A2A4|nr:ABC transporter permease [Succinispira mobilis]
MDSALLIAILAASITAGTPILFAALGELITERAGILNLGVEGIMLVGAVAGFISAYVTADPWVGIIAAMILGMLMALIHAFLTITLRANQVVSGLAITLFGTGLSGYIGKNYVGLTLPKAFTAQTIPFLSDIPFIGEVFFKHDPLVYLSYILVIFFHFYLYYTTPGLKLRALGENPGATDAMGINVFFLRYCYVLLGGGLCGLAGAYLSLAYAPSWLENMTAGRGWIAVALVIFALWNPWRALLGSYLFGGIDALGFHLQVLGVPISVFLLNMLPYIFTIIVLILVLVYKKGKISAPSSLGVAYNREER